MTYLSTRPRAGMKRSLTGASRRIEDLETRLRRLEEDNAALRRMAESTEETVLKAERDRVAEQLHDGVAQALALVMLKIEIIARLVDRDIEATKAELEQASALTELCLDQLRSAVYSLRSPDVERLGFRRALERLCKGINQETDLEIGISVQEPVPLPTSTHLLIFQILQRRLDQVAKAGSSSRLSISVSHDGHVLAAQLREERILGTEGLNRPVPWTREQEERVCQLGGRPRFYLGQGERVLEIVLPVGSPEAG